MPKLNMAQTFELELRDRYSKVECKIGIDCDGRELPNAEIIGSALERFITELQEHVKESFNKVPERV